MPLLKLKKPQKTPGNIVFIFASLENLRLVNRQGRWRVGLNKTLVLKLHFCTSFKFLFFGCENLFFQILWKNYILCFILITLELLRLLHAFKSNLKVCFCL